MSKTQKLLLRARSQLQLFHLLCEVQAKGWDGGDPDWVTRGKDGRFGGGGSTPTDSVADMFAKLTDQVTSDIEAFSASLPKEQRLVFPGFANAGLADLYRESIVLQGEMAESSNDEILAKIVSYADASALSKPTNPVSKVMSEELARRGMVVEKVVDDSGESGFKAWGINDKDGNNPRLVITGTELKLDDIADIREDLLGEIGDGQYAYGKKFIDEYIKTAKDNGNKVTVIGHSLGGAIAQMAAIDNSNDVKNVTTFNSPGIGEYYEKKILKVASEMQVEHHVTKDDIVSLGGDMFLPGDVKLRESSGNLLENHLGMIGEKKESTLSIDDLNSDSYTAGVLTRKDQKEYRELVQPVLQQILGA